MGTSSPTYIFHILYVEVPNESKPWLNGITMDSLGFFQKFIEIGYFLVFGMGWYQKLLSMDDTHNLEMAVFITFLHQCASVPVSMAQYVVNPSS